MQSIKLETVKETKNLQRFITEQIAAEDIPYVIQAIAIEEINQQKAIKNPPSNIIIDGRRDSSEQSIHSAKRQVRAFFANAALLAKAAADTHRMLVKATKRKTGTARGSYEFWYAKNYKEDGRSFGRSVSVVRTIAEGLPNEGFIRIVGPLTAYGRKIYWGQGQGKKSTYGRGKRDSSGLLEEKTSIRGARGFKAVKTLALHRAILRIIRRRYPTIKFTDPWVETHISAGKTHAPRRFPTISIGYKFKGLIR